MLASRAAVSAGVRGSARLAGRTAIAIAALCLGPAAFLLAVAPAPLIVHWALVAVASGALLWRIGPAAGISLALFALASIVPELVTEVRFAWKAAASAASGHGHVALAGVAGGTHLLVGLALPLVAFLRWGLGRGKTIALDDRQARALWLLLLASMYGFSVYLKAFLSVLDTLFLLLLFAAYLWSSLRAERPATGGSAAASRVRVGAIVPAVCLGVLVALAAVPLAGAVTSAEGAYGLVVAQWLVPLASKLGLLAVLGVLVWKARLALAISALLSAQIAHLTVLVGALPLAFFAHGLALGDAGFLYLDELQRSEVLLASAETLLLVVLLARMTVSLRSAAALVALFLLQIAFGTAQAGGQSAFGTTIPLSQSTPKTAVLMGSGAECIGGRRRRDFQCAMTLYSASRAQIARLSQRIMTPAGPIYISRRGICPLVRRSSCCSRFSVLSVDERPAVQSSVQIGELLL